MTGREGRVTIRTSVGGDGKVAVEVADQGPEVPAAVLSEMFDPFFSTKPEGLGMGLPICRTIVEAHGGRLEVHKEESGGLVLRFDLPLGAGDPATSS